MKIRELRFKNLNALLGEWCIDFTHPAYTTEGVFALTGKTGAGKSTILDAICLALYGATPRLGKITKSANDIMSKQAGECYAEIVFESQEGVFRCHFEQRRARKQPDGKLQEPEHSIAKAITGELIETKKSIVLQVIEEKTGMDFERFTRSILLAQGDFDAFLRADAEQKSKILEQITGTGIYTKISQQVHERLRCEKEQLLILRSQTQGLSPLSETELSQLNQQRCDIEQKLKTTVKEIKQIQNAINWQNAIIELKKELRLKTDEEQALNHQITAFQPQQQILNKANQALAIESIYTSLNMMRQLQAANIHQEQELKAKRPALQELYDKTHKALTKAESQADLAKNELKGKLPLFQKIRAIDNTINEKKQRLQELDHEHHQASKAIDANKNQRIALDQKLKEIEQTNQQAMDYVNHHKQDGWLIKGLTGLKQQLLQLNHHQHDLENQNKELKNAYVSRENLHQKYHECHQQLTQKANDLTLIKQSLALEQEQLAQVLESRNLREYHSEKEHLLRELAYVKKIESLEAERDKLQSGQPCPLCGAKEHPFAINSTPKPNAIEEKISLITDIITKAHALEATISTYTQKISQAHEQHTQIEQSLKQIAFEQQQLDKDIDKKQQQLTKTKDAHQALITLLQNELTPIGIEIKGQNPIEAIIKNLELRQTKWQEQEQLTISCAPLISQMTTEIQHLNQTLLQQSKILEEKSTIIQDTLNHLNAIIKERANDFQDKMPDIEEQALYVHIDELDKQIALYRSQHQDTQNQILAIDTKINALQSDINHRLTMIKEQEATFAQALEQSGFINEHDFVQSRLSPDDRNRLAGMAKSLDELKTRLHGQIHQLQDKLHLEIEKNLSTQSLEQLNTDYQLKEHLHKQLTDEYSHIIHRLASHEEAQSMLAENQQLIDAQEKECARFFKLHTLIGSADGKKYRNFAQGLTFELVIHHANQQLKKLSDRYLLIHNQEEPLSLSVIDQYQASEIRSTKNLSGGERFIMSLALALGLSKMSSQNVRVDSLFLDEGFGTLDEDSLETALDALAELHQSGKLIGIISHIAALKERISTQINIIPMSLGNSKIKGPGCSEINR